MISKNYRFFSEFKSTGTKIYVIRLLLKKGANLLPVVKLLVVT